VGTELCAGADPAALVPGDPDALDELARTLGVFAHGMGAGADRLGAIRAGDWTGHGGNAFRGLIGEQPVKFGTASDSFGAAKAAVTEYAEVLREAQHTAGQAVSRFGSGEQATGTWRSRSSGAAHPGDDPGAADRAAAARLLSDARGRVATEALRLSTTLSGAEHGAPKKPSFWHRAVSGLTGVFTHRFGGTLIHLGEGIGDGVSGMAQGMWALTGAVVTDPAKFARSWQGLLYAVGMPPQRRAFALSFVDWGQWSNDPARALGHTAVNVASIFVGGSGLAAKAGDAARIATETPAVAELSPEMLAVTKATETNPATLDGFPAWRGLTDRANWAQRKYSANFSKKGDLHERPVKDVVSDLRRGIMSPVDLPVSIIRRGQNVLMLNTRSSQALTLADIPRSEWIVKDVTGNPGFERRLNEQLRISKVDETGWTSLRQSLGPPHPKR
jgi:hypothetical protein